MLPVSFQKIPLFGGNGVRWRAVTCNGVVLPIVRRIELGFLCTGNSTMAIVLALQIRRGSNRVLPEGLRIRLEGPFDVGIQRTSY